MALRTVILNPGECAIIPSTATIQSVVIDGSVTTTSTCPNVPAPSSYACWRFFWEASEDGALQDAEFKQLTIGTNVYNIPSAYADYNNSTLLDPDYDLKLADWIDNDPQLTGLVRLGCDSDSSGMVLKVQIPEGLPAPQLKIVNPSGAGDQTLYMFGELDEDCEDC